LKYKQNIILCPNLSLAIVFNPFLNQVDK